jgi:dihydroceramidase
MNLASTIDFCEQNYVINSHIAEFFNTISNISYVLLGLFGFLLNRKFENRFKFGFITLILVGLGSSFFHGSLLWIGQLTDELSMMLLTIITLFILIEHYNRKIKYKLLPIFLFIFYVCFSFVYIIYKNVIIFQSVWLLLIIFIVFIFYKHNQDANRSFYKHIYFIFLLSCICWGFEQLFCFSYPQIEKLYLHAFVWHLGTAYASYSLLTHSMFMRTKYVLFSNSKLNYIFYIFPIVKYSKQKLFF